MGKPAVNIDHQWIQRNVLANPQVRKAIDQTGRRLAPAVRLLALKEADLRYAQSVRLTTGGTRPGAKSPTRIKRPFARVTVGDPQAADKEHGVEGKVPKKGFLRRAARLIQG